MWKATLPDAHLNIAETTARARIYVPLRVVAEGAAHLQEQCVFGGSSSGGAAGAEAD